MLISDLIIVAVAPLESVIVTSLLLKSIPDSFMILSPASTESLSVPFKVISPLPVSSSNKNPLFPSLSFSSVPSRTRLVPTVSAPTTNPAPVLSESYPSNNNIAVESLS